ncbi:MAG: hypothetical protein A4E71_02531 [Smithella sp. PtaU1.Bin162]|nr:MAG: hypothetical protein A4E71_02531 [Smithella sp. PtaU1.Bin162]
MNIYTFAGRDKLSIKRYCTWILVLVNIYQIVKGVE